MTNTPHLSWPRRALALAGLVALVALTALVRARVTAPPRWLDLALVALVIGGLGLAVGRAWPAGLAAAAVAVGALAHAPMALAVARGQYVALSTPPVARFAPVPLLLLGVAAAVMAGAAMAGMVRR